MRNTLLFLLLFSLYSAKSIAQSSPKTIHVFVALCDNVNQGIVPVPKAIGNGQDARNNLYWGALYGVKTHFKKSSDWTLISSEKNINSFILERCLFKHKTSNTYLLADAYNGKHIKQTIVDFLEATAGHFPETLTHNKTQLCFGGDANLAAYIGHDGLMEFNVKGNFNSKNNTKRDAIILACISKSYFKPYLEKTKANPLVWSTGLMSPEAYTLKWAIDGWVLNETNKQIRERAAQAYNKYQKCGIRGARNLLVTGF